MDTKKEAEKYLSKYFKAQYINETDIEYRDLVKLLNKALRIHDVSGKLPLPDTSNMEHKRLMKALYPKDKSKRFKR